VPALRQGDFLLRESLIINEYIEELAHQPSLLPVTAQQRAEARLWIDFASSRLVPAFYRLLKAQKEDDRTAAREDLLAGLTILNGELSGRRERGPYWFGKQVGLTDLACYPWFERWPVLEHYRGLAIPGELKSLLSWIAAMKDRDAVKQGGEPADFYIEAYEDYASGKK
jgi:glutathione S-transferase